MSQNHHLPTSDCAAVASLLPLAAHNLLSEAEDSRLRSHLATCAHCRAELHVYDQVEEALRRTFTPRQGQGALPPFSREELIEILDHPTDHPAPVAPLPAPQAPERRPRRLLPGLAALAATLVIVVLAASIFAIYAHRGQTAGPVLQSTPTVIPPRGSQTWLTSISMVSPTEGWAIGHSEPATDANDSSVVLMHYQHDVWAPVHTDLKGRINSISMDSATDGWAVGDLVMLHYDGKTWQSVTDGPQALLNQVQMLSPTDGWATGLQPGTSLPTAVWHYDGHAWTAQPLPASLALASTNSLFLSSLSMLSPTEGWAAGTLVPYSTASTPTQAPSGVILRYSGGQWRVDDLMSGATLQSISIASAAEGWAAGHTDRYTPTTINGQPGSVDTTLALLLHYTGGKWVKVPNPDYTGDQSQGFGTVSLSSATEGWLTGGNDALSGAPILLHYSGTVWQQVSMPAIKGARSYTIFDIAMTSASEGWAVGASLSTEANGIPNPQGHGYQPTVTPVILHYLNGAWSVYSQG